MANPQKLTEISVGGTLDILHASAGAGITRVILANSLSVYGKLRSLPCEEDHPTEPVSPHGVTKLTQDHMARVHTELHGLSTVCLRYITVYSPRTRPNMTISNFVLRCMNGDSPVIYRDGRQTCDFRYVTDVVDANRTLLESAAADGGVMNIGSSDNSSIKQLDKMDWDQLAPGLDIEHDSAQEADAEHTHACVNVVSEMIGYQPSRTIVRRVEAFTS